MMPATLQADLFGTTIAPARAAVPARLTRADASVGRTLGHEGAERAAKSANRKNAEWTELALAEFLAFGAAHGGTFTTEDVRARCAARLPAPPDARAWGQVALAAKRLGRIAWHGYAPAKDRKSRGCPGNVWNWVVEGGQT